MKSDTEQAIAGGRTAKNELAMKFIATGDEQCFALLYEEHRTSTFNLCLRLTGSREVAEELTQEAFLQLYRKIKTFRGDACFTTWFHRLTLNVVFMYFRRKKRRKMEVTEADLAGQPASVGFPSCLTQDRSLTSAADRVTLDRLIARLPLGYRTVFVLHDIEGYPHHAIAAMRGCSVGTSKSQLNKARRRMRELLGYRFGVRQLE